MRGFAKDMQKYYPEMLNFEVVNRALLAGRTVLSVRFFRVDRVAQIRSDLAKG